MVHHMTRPEPMHKGMMLLTPDFLENPYPEYAALRSQSPVIWLEALNAWLLTGYEAVQTAFLEPKLRVDFEQYQINRNGPTVVEEFYFKQFSNSIVAHDPPRHSYIRRMFRQALSRPQIDPLHECIEQQCNRFIEEILTNAAAIGVNQTELVENYSNRVPHYMISSILGVPEEERSDVASFVAGYAPVAEATPMTDAQLVSVNVAARGLDDYFSSLMLKKRADPDDGFISRMIALNEEADVQLTEDELRANFLTLYVGGQDTQEKLFTNIILALNDHPEAMQRLAENPANIDTCIHELYRYDTAGQFMGRTATEDVEIHGVNIPKGETVVCSWAAANRDPDKFKNPDVLDLDRVYSQNTPHHMSFGVGRHSCIGVSLAQSNIPRMLKTLLTRLGPLEIDFAKSVRHLSIATRGFDSMQIKWN